MPSAKPFDGDDTSLALRVACSQRVSLTPRRGHFKIG